MDEKGSPDMMDDLSSNPQGVSMSDYSNPALPLVVGAGVNGYREGFCSGDAAAHVLNSDLVACGQHAILSKIDALSAADNLRETLHGQCAIEKSIGDVRQEVEQGKTLNRLVQCEVQSHVSREAQATRDLINLDIRRRDDARIRELELKLALAKQCGCGCGSVSVPGNGNGGPGNS